MDTKALFKISYGLYILSAKEDNKDNACIINTLQQYTSSPCKIGVTVSKANYTCAMIQQTKKFNVSVLSQESNFDIFKTFGFQSGKDINKFENFKDVKRSENGILYISKNTNAYFSANVTEIIDLDSHILFIAQTEHAEVLAPTKTVTYNYYHENIKPKPKDNNSKGWRCKICGYVYKEEVLPNDYICPLCKHGSIDFEKI